MNKKQLIVAWMIGLISALILLLPCISFLSYAGNLLPEENIEEIKKKAPEFIIEEEQLDYNSYLWALERLQVVLDWYRNGKKVAWDFENIGVSNYMLTLTGYGLIQEREIIRLKLENAKLKGTEEEIADLEKALDEAERQIEVFLSENIWVD